MRAQAISQFSPSSGTVKTSPLTATASNVRDRGLVGRVVSRIAAILTEEVQGVFRRILSPATAARLSKTLCGVENLVTLTDRPARREASA